MVSELYRLDRVDRIQGKTDLMIHMDSFDHPIRKNGLSFLPKHQYLHNRIKGHIVGLLGGIDIGKSKSGDNRQIVPAGRAFFPEYIPPGIDYKLAAKIKDRQGFMLPDGKSNPGGEYSPDIGFGDERVCKQPLPCRCKVDRKDVGPFGYPCRIDDGLSG